MTTYCLFCGWKIGQITFDNLNQMKKKYQDHIVTKHELREVAQRACWTTENTTGAV